MGVNSYIDMVSMQQHLQNALESEAGHIYKRIAKGFEKIIQNKTILAGQKLPTHRALSDSLSVTPGTISHAYKELEKLGLVISRVGDGTYVQGNGDRSVSRNDFNNVADNSDDIIDLSRNSHIEGKDQEYFLSALKQVYSNTQVVSQLTKYTSDLGLDRHRKAGAKWLEKSNIVADYENVICTNGAQHALLCSLLSILKKGDTIATEKLSYPGLISLSKKLGVKLIGLELDEQGLVPELLDEACKTQHISVLYCTPTFQNPTTVTMSEERRAAIAHVAKIHNLIIIEDDAHGVMAKNRPAAMQVFAPERTILISSLTKAISEGVRVGYILSPSSLVDVLSSTLRSTTWMATPLSHEIATQWINEGVADRLLLQQTEEINNRKILASAELEGLNYLTQENCGHFWIEVPEPWRCTEIETELSRKGVLVKSAEAFAVGRKEASQYIRACVGSAQNSLSVTQGFRAIQFVLRE